MFTSVDEGLELARVEQDRGDIQAALEVYAAIRKFEPGHSAPYLRAAALLGREGKQHESEQLFADGVRNSPNDVSLSIGYAIVAHQRGDFEEAVRRWSVAHERFPFHEGVFPHYLSTLELTGRHAQAADLRQQLGQQLETRGSAADSSEGASPIVRADASDRILPAPTADPAAAGVPPDLRGARGAGLGRPAERFGLGRILPSFGRSLQSRKPT